MLRFRHILFFCLSFGFGWGFCYPQSSPQKDSTISSLITQLSGVWNNNKSETFSDLLKDHEKIPTNLPVKAVETIAIKRTDLLLRRNLLMQRIYSRDIGISLTSSYQRNTGVAVIDPAQDIVAFRQKFQLGVDWDFLNGGLLQNRFRLKELQNEQELIKNSSFIEKNSRPYLLSAQQVVVNFNRRKLYILNKRKELNEKHMALIEKLWSMRHISKDDYLRGLQHKTDISGQFDLYSSFSDKAAALHLKPNDSISTPLLDLDFEKLLAKVNYVQQAGDTSLPGALIKNAKLESRFIKEIGLKAYTRYNYYDVYSSTQPNRSFMSVGLNLNVPIFFASKQKQELYLLNKRLEMEQQQAHVEPGIEFLLLNYYYDYRYKLKKYFNLIEKRNVFAELVRTEKVKQEYTDVEFNPSTALFILDDYWSNAVELLDLHQDMYKMLINIKEKVPGAEISDFTFPVTLKNDVKDSTFVPVPVKSIYVWSKGLINSTPELLSDYCEINGFNNIVISYKYDKAYLQILKAFINKNYTRKISLMIGNNKLINGGMQIYLDSMVNALPLNFVKAIHLDVEPHTFDDFKDKKDEYFEKYISCVETAAAFCKKYKLNLEVSIPLFYPENVLTYLFANCDKVYLMAYENVDADFINKKIEEELRLGKDKVVLALRAKDFANRLEMDEQFKKLNVKNIAYHDFETLIELDKKAINVKDGDK